MKIGIITFHNASNYGAVLQAFALQEVVKEIKKGTGSTVEIIHYDNPFLTKGLDQIRFSASVHGVYNAVQDILAYVPRKKKRKRFERFFRRYYQLSVPMRKEEILQSACYDVAISGSDQIWNPLLNQGLDEAYFLQSDQIKKRISYASSVGAYRFESPIYNQKLKQYLTKYDKITVRENAKGMENLLGFEIEEMCDPTLLLSKKEWKQKIPVHKAKHKYLLVYALSDFSHVFSVARQIAKAKGLEIHSAGDVPFPYQGRKNHNDAGPGEFIGLFLNASYIVTNSFHGTAFAVNFRKQFVSVVHKKSPERAQSFLKKVGLESRLVGSCWELGGVKWILGIASSNRPAENCISKRRRHGAF